MGFDVSSSSASGAKWLAQPFQGGLLAKNTPPEWHLASAFGKAEFACREVGC